jgi:hypothetical protein
MFILWNPTKVEIESWLKTRELDFAQKDNKNTNITPCKYLDRYVFRDLHEVFFYDFPHVLQEWILRLKDKPREKSYQTVRVKSFGDRALQQVDKQIHAHSRFLVRQYYCRIYHRICNRHSKVLQHN